MCVCGGGGRPITVFSQQLPQLHLWVARRSDGRNLIGPLGSSMFMNLPVQQDTAPPGHFLLRGQAHFLRAGRGTKEDH